MSSEMSSLKASAADELRMKNYRSQLERRNEAELRDLQARHEDELERIITTRTDQINDLRGAYDVKISEEAEHLEDRLSEIRHANQQRIENQEQSAEDEYSKLQFAHRQRIEEFKRNSETQLNTLRKQLQASANALHEQARKYSHSND